MAGVVHQRSSAAAKDFFLAKDSLFAEVHICSFIFTSYIRILFRERKFSVLFWFRIV